MTTQAVVLSTPQFSAEKSPIPGVVPPMVPGEANVAPLKLLAFRLATLVVLATVSGAVPVATDEISCVPVTVVVAAIVPGAIKVAGMERTGVVVPVATEIWLVVPVTLVTVPLPVPTATPLTYSPVALSVPAPSAPPVALPTTTPAPASVISELPTVEVPHVKLGIVFAVPDPPVATVCTCWMPVEIETATEPDAYVVTSTQKSVKPFVL